MTSITDVSFSYVPFEGKHPDDVTSCITTTKEGITRDVKLSDVFDAIRKYDTVFMTDNAYEIGIFYENLKQSVVTHSTYRMYTDKNVKSLFQFLSQPYYETEKLGSHGCNDAIYFKSLMFLIDNHIVNPNKIINGNLLIASCLINYTDCQMEYERIKFLIEHTSAETIRDFRDEFGCTIILCMLSGSCHFSDDVFDEFHDIFVKMGVDINAVGYYKDDDKENNNIPFQYLYYMAMRCDVKRVKIALDLGQDPNMYIDSVYFRETNIAQNLLKKYCKAKRLEVISDIIEIMRLLVSYGLDLSFKDSDNCNIMDYVLHYKWGNTNMTKILDENGCPYATGNIPYEPLYAHLPDAYSITPALKLLYDNQYEKNADRLAEILCELKRMKENGVDFKAEKARYDFGQDQNIYNTICAYGSWHDSDVADYLEKEIA